MGETIVRTRQDSFDSTDRGVGLWYPPLTLWQLFALMVATCGVYAVFWVYRVAKDIREHGDGRVKPAMYSVSLLFGIVAVFSSARLTWRVLSLRGGERRKHQNLPALVSLLVFLTYCFAFVAELGEIPALYIVSVLLFPLPWLLIQSRMNEVTSTFPDTDFRSPAFRFSRRQLVAMCLGLAMWATAWFSLQLEFEHRAGVPLTSNQIVRGGSGRYSIRIPSGAWYRVTPGTIGDERSDLELLGPSMDTWAVAYLHRNVALAEVLALRAEQIHRYGDVEYSAVREPGAESSAGISYVSYAVEDPFGRTWNWITTAELQQSVVELIVSSRHPDNGNPSALAKSLTISR